MVQVTQSRTQVVELTNDEALKVTLTYLTDIVVGVGCYITDGGRLEHWTSYPHGSGTTTDMGIPTDIQRAAWDFIKAHDKLKANAVRT